jgi:hypothetical protein
VKFIGAAHHRGAPLQEPVPRGVQQCGGHGVVLHYLKEAEAPHRFAPVLVGAVVHKSHNGSHHLPPLPGQQAQDIGMAEKGTALGVQSFHLIRD